MSAPGGHRGDVGDPVRQAGAPHARIPRRPAAAAGGEAVDAVGETVTARGALQIAGAPEPDVYLAALGPQMLKLAGRRTAGTLTWMTGPKTLGEHVGADTARGRRRGRPSGGRGAGGGGAAGQRHRRRRGGAGAGRRTVRDLRVPAVVSRDARPRGVLRIRRTPPSSATRNTVSDRLDELAASASTSSPRSSSTRRLRCANAPGRCCGRRTHDGPNSLWCDRGHRRTVDRTTGSGVTDPKCRQEVKADRARLMRRPQVSSRTRPFLCARRMFAHLTQKAPNGASSHGRRNTLNFERLRRLCRFRRIVFNSGIG